MVLEWHTYEREKISSREIPGMPEYWPRCPCKTCKGQAEKR